VRVNFGAGQCRVSPGVGANWEGDLRHRRNAYLGPHPRIEERFMSAPTLPGRQHQPSPVAQRHTEPQTDPPHTAPDQRGALSRPTIGPDSEDALLVNGYLAAVAASLDQRGIMVRELRATGSAPLAGMMTLDCDPDDGARWAPTRLSWQEHQGWAAALCSPESTADQGRSEVLRYLPRHLVPAPDTVAHFAAALTADAHTVWACNAVHQPPRIDRRWLRLQLSRFALPEPW
jgi:hypothetical protein